MQHKIKDNAPPCANDTPTPRTQAGRIKLAHALTGSALEASLLAHVWYWLPRATIRDEEGRPWVVQTAKEIVAGGLPWSERSIKRGIAALKARGLIRVRHAPHPYGERDRLHCMWITADAPGPKEAAVPGTDAEQNGGIEGAKSYQECSAQAVSGGPFKRANLAPSKGPTWPLPLYTHTYSQTYVAEADAAHLACKTEDGGQTSPEGLQGGVSGNFGGNLMEGDLQMATLAEIGASVKAKRVTWDPSKPLNPQALGQEFRTAWLETYPEEPPPPMTDVRKGQLRHLINWARGEAGSNDAELVRAVVAVVGNWAGFVKFVEARTSLRLKEARPRHETLLGRRDQVLAYLRLGGAADPASGAAIELAQPADATLEDLFGK